MFLFTELQAVGTLLGVQPILLQKGLTLRTYSSERGEVVQSPCSAAAVSDIIHSTTFRVCVYVCVCVCVPRLHKPLS